MNQKRQTNSLDVAALAGVSQATVSRAFTPGASVSGKTRTRILAAAEKLGYHPNVIARSLSKNQSRQIGVLFGNWAHPKAAELLKGISETLMQHDYMAVVQSANEHRSVDDVLREFLQYRVDGVIIFSAAPSTELAAEYFRCNVPIVLLNHSADALNTSSVVVDAGGIGHKIGAALLARSYRRVAVVSADPTSRVVTDMTGAISQAMATDDTAGIISQTSGVYGYEAGSRLMRELWARAERPDAIVCMSDYTALGMLAACRHELDVEVPESLGIIGLGDIPVAAWKDHELTTVNIPHAALVEKTVATLLGHIEMPESDAVAIRLEAELVNRRTIRDTANA